MTILIDIGDYNILIKNNTHVTQIKKTHLSSRLYYFLVSSCLNNNTNKSNTKAGYIAYHLTISLSIDFTDIGIQTKRKWVCEVFNQFSSAKNVIFCLKAISDVVIIYSMLNRLKRNILEIVTRFPEMIL